MFGAICPAKGKGAGLILPWCDTHAMNAHLDEISAAIDPGAHAVLVVDQAGWHLTPKLRLPKNISILPLPPRAPELSNNTSCTSVFAIIQFRCLIICTCWDSHISGGKAKKEERRSNSNKSLFIRARKMSVFLWQLVAPLVINIPIGNIVHKGKFVEPINIKVPIFGIFTPQHLYMLKVIVPVVSCPLITGP